MGSVFVAVFFSTLLAAQASVDLSYDPGYVPSDLESDVSTAALFDRWCQQYIKSYATDEEKLNRLAIFRDRLSYIDAHNREESHSYKQGLNQFSDLSREEVEAAFGGSKISGKIQQAPAKVVGADSSLPASIDWRWKGAVTLVKDVGQCRGATWAYAAAGTVEASLKLNGHDLADLSAQQLIDCVDDSYNRKCKFGFPPTTLEYVQENGLAKQKAYPFTGKNDSKCGPLPDELVTIAGVERVDGSDLLAAVAKQPVAVTIDGSTEDFINYKSGIFTGKCSDETLSQSLLIVGYGTNKGVDFWTLKNSWGMAWGEAGYMRMKRGICGVTNFPSYAVGAAPAKRNLPCEADQKCPSGMSCCCREPVVGTKCISHMCCPSKYDCKNGCCNEKKVTATMGEVLFTSNPNQTAAS